MMILTPEETLFLDAFLHETTTSPFAAPATHALHKIGVEYGDISYIAWAYNRDVPRSNSEGGAFRSSCTAAPLANPRCCPRTQPGNPRYLGTGTRTNGFADCCRVKSQPLPLFSFPERLRCRRSDHKVLTCKRGIGSDDGFPASAEKLHVKKLQETRMT
jgi:hypothetical protein